MSNEQIQSLWLATVPESNFGHLKDDVAVDIAIIGGGIAGLSIAYALRNEGKKIAVFEAVKIAHGTSGNTTAKITSMHDLKYAFLENKVGLDGARIYAKSQEWAIDTMKNIIDAEHIDCDFSYASLCAYAESDDGLEQLKKEFESVKKLSIQASLDFHDASIPFPIRGVLKFEKQAYFHPGEYMYALAKILSDSGVAIYEYTRIDEFEEGDVWTLHAKGKTVKAQTVIIATDYPIYDKALFFLRMNQMRSYALAVQLHTPLPRDMYVGIDGGRLTFRPYVTETEQWLICGGVDHATGTMQPNENPFEQLEELVKKHFPVKSVDYRWAAQDSMPIDKIPYIGKMPMTKNMYVATGFGEWGMTTSVVSAKIISDLILGRKNEWEHFYSPSRLQAHAALEGISSQVSHVVKGFGSYVSKTEKLDEQAIARGEGKVTAHQGEKTAAYKDADGNMHVVSAKCSHMGCVVQWNGAENSWDCPCHGSRFTVDGGILNSPARKKLPKIDM